MLENLARLLRSSTSLCKLLYVVSVRTQNGVVRFGIRQHESVAQNLSITRRSFIRRFPTPHRHSRLGLFFRLAYEYEKGRCIGCAGSGRTQNDEPASEALVSLAKYKIHFHTQGGIDLRRQARRIRGTLPEWEELTLGEYIIHFVVISSHVTTPRTEFVCIMMVLTLCFSTLLTRHACACLVSDCPRLLVPSIIDRAGTLSAVQVKNREVRRHSTVSIFTAYTGTYLQFKGDLSISCIHLSLVNGSLSNWGVYW